MSSIDRKRIVGKSDEELDELICGICHDVYEEPVVTKCCQQTYCCVCINQWLIDNNTCPNDRQYLNTSHLLPTSRSLINLINKMSIKCEYNSNGCEVISTVGEIKNHIKTCNKRSVLKCNSCEESKKVITNYEKEIKELKEFLKSKNNQVQKHQNEIEYLKKTNESLRNKLRKLEMSELELINEARSYRPTVDEVNNCENMSNAMVQSFLNLSINAVNNSENNEFYKIADQIQEKMSERWDDFQFIVYVMNGSNCKDSDEELNDLKFFEVNLGPLLIEAWKVNND